MGSDREMSGLRRPVHEPGLCRRLFEGHYSHYVIDEPHWEEPELYCHNFYLSLAERYASGKGRLLDVGTGTGYLLRVAKDRGWDPWGMTSIPKR